ncbi:MAG TPA: acetyl-CoA carboxylase carboxyl transferase subunit beta, partial [Gammaproteobacteria bacterium]|nr:acetyl-CoA carboxylase carboxyl transferase subunit beta [Gammaproteobacteria bacterium]
MSWYEKLVPSRIRTDGRNKHQIPEGLWSKCEKCDAVLYRVELERNLQVCPKCSHHMPLGARQRLRSFLDPEGLTEIGEDIEPADFLKFKDSKKY